MPGAVSPQLSAGARELRVSACSGWEPSVPFARPSFLCRVPSDPAFSCFTAAPKGPQITTTPSRARVGDTVRILVHGFQVSLALSTREAGGRWSGPSLSPFTSSAASRPVS